MKKISWLAVGCCGAFLFFTAKAFGHCDGLDGPVVSAAEKALANGDVNLVLVWVQKNDEAEITKTFADTLAVRKLGTQARELADRHFFETLVRVHRAGEGAGFTGLKPAGRDLGPAIPAADKALADGNSDALLKLLTKTVEERVQHHLQEVLSKRNYDSADVAAGRDYVKAYVEYIHFIEALYAVPTNPADGHYPDESAAEPHPKDKNSHEH